MESRKRVPMILSIGAQRKHRPKEQTFGHSEGESEMIWQNSIETYTLSYVK